MQRLSDTQATVLLVNVGFVPRVGGSFRALYEMARRFPIRSIQVLTSHHRGEEEFDRSQELTITRSSILSLLDDEGTVPELGYKAPIRHIFAIRVLIKLKVFTVVAMFLLLLRTLWAVGRVNYDFLLAGQAWVVGWPVWLAARLWGKQYGVFVYGEDVSVIKHGRKDLISRLFLKSLAGAKWIVCNSSPTAAVTASLGVDRSKIHVVPPAVDLSLFKKRSSALRADLNIRNTPVILTVGRLVPRKGFDLVIRALPNIHQRVPGAVYLIRGDGAEKEKLIRLARKLGVEEHVKFLGEVSYEELPAVYNACDVFVMPNRCDPVTGEQEGFGMVFVEASACGKPVIGGRSGGAVDAVSDGESGFLVSGTDPDELADRIAELMLDPDLRFEMAENGRRFVESHCSWDVHAAEIWKLCTMKDMVAGLPVLGGSGS